MGDVARPLRVVIMEHHPAKGRGNVLDAGIIYIQISNNKHSIKKPNFKSKFNELNRVKI